MPKPKIDNKPPMVAVGASAGGFEAFSRFLKALPADTGLAIVFVQHLSPDHESNAAALLAPQTAMAVHEARDGERVKPNNVYLLPPNKSMLVVDGHLKLMPREKVRPMPIDYFMRSLAEIEGPRAIGVVLSGMGSDGTLGLEAIKAQGGVTFAQSPESAKFPSMPASAIATHCVDNVMTLEEMARELSRISRHPYLHAPKPAPETPTMDAAETAASSEQGELERIFGLLRRATGVDFKLYKSTTLRRRIARRMLVHRLDHLAEYTRVLQDNAPELDALYHDLLINVTQFFRDPEAFEYLSSHIFPQLAGRANDAPIRIWVPGCASGEEVYSLAICLLETMGGTSTNWPVQIFATDLSENALDTAREGRYLENIALDVSPERLNRFFVKTPNGYQISKPIRDLCIFARQNMISDPPFSKLDLISCRNVLIYFDSQLQKRVIPLFHYALKPSGYLLLGTSETIGAYADLFEQIDKKQRIFVKTPAVGRAYVDFAAPRASEAAPALPRPPVSDETLLLHEVQREAEQIILARYRAAGVVIDHNMEILQFRGDTAPFIQHLPGNPSLNLLKLANSALSLELRGMIHECRAQAATVTRDWLEVRQDGEDRNLRLEVFPLHVQHSKVAFFLVLFQSQPPAAPASQPGPQPANESSDALRRRSEQLATELIAARQQLQSIIEEHEATNEELQSSNEEVLSSNEELQSINEELETAKEELQSTNEELTTVNEELQNRNTELSTLNNDLSNLLSSVSIPIVMLSSDLRIRRFTPLAERLLSLIPSDVGRPLGDIKPRINMPDLESLVAEVIETVSMKELEVRDKEGRWYSMRIRPYKTRDNKIDGAVIALLEIDTLKRCMEELKQHGEFVDALLQTSKQPLLILDYNFRIVKANTAFYKTYGFRHAELDNKKLFDLPRGQWNIPKLRRALEALLKSKRPTKLVDLKIEYKPAKAATRHMVVNARRLERTADGVGRLLVVLDDRT